VFKHICIVERAWDILICSCI